MSFRVSTAISIKSCTPAPLEAILQLHLDRVYVNALLKLRILKESIMAPNVIAIALIPQGATAIASGIAFRTWFPSLVTSINPNSPVVLNGGILSSMRFHHLSLSEYTDITEQLQTRLILDWYSSLKAAGLSAGTFYIVKSKGKGSIEAE